MTEPDGDASYSPVPSHPTTEPTPPPPGAEPGPPTWASPGGTTPPPSTPYGPAAAAYPYPPSPYAPTPYAPQLPPGYRPGGPPPPSPGSAASGAGPQQRRTRVVIGLVTGVVLLVGACVGIGTAVSRAREEFTDDQGRVTIRAPYSWDGGGGESDAVSGEPTPDEKADGYEYEDLYLSSFLGDYYVSVYVDDGPPTDTIDAVQARSVDEECRIWTCESRGTPTAVTIGGQPAVEQVVTVSANGTGRVEVVLTVRTPTMVVRTLASRDWDRGDPPDSKRLISVLHSMTFAR